MPLFQNYSQRIFKTKGPQPRLCWIGKLSVPGEQALIPSIQSLSSSEGSSLQCNSHSFLNLPIANLYPLLQADHYADFLVLAL